MLLQQRVIKDEIYAFTSKNWISKLVSQYAKYEDIIHEG